MCGIAGVLGSPSAAPVDLEVLRRMVSMLGHRGPDGYGLYRDDRVGLGHARLSIIDLDGGFQPIHNEDESIWLTFNGEIFNYLELRRALQSKGHSFYTDGDSEVIVHAFEEYGERAWSMFNGQFAFALWDVRSRQLWLVRDRFGILPLQYALTADGLVFASEAKALFASGALAPELDPTGVNEVFTRWSPLAPRTAFAGVRSVKPGTALVVDHELGVRERAYWTPEFALDPELAGLSLDEAADRLEAQLRDAVQLRLRADVPVGAYLSGGLDSSVISSLVRSSESSPLETFSVAFEDPTFDESTEQARMAALLGTRHHTVVCDDAAITESLAAVVWHCEAPLLRTAPVPLFLLSALVREASMKVVLTGEGADELLAGYSIFKEDKVRRFWARDPESTMRAALLARLHPEVQGGDARASEMWRRFFGRDLEATDAPYYSHAIRWQNVAWSRRVLAPDLQLEAAGDGAAHVDEELDALVPSDWFRWDPLARAQWIEIQTFLSSYLLAFQGDRVAMAHGVEVRYPFLDPEVVSLCLALPARLRMPALRDKVTLRRVGARSLPREIWQRPKQPYRAPMTPPLFGSGRADLVEEFLSTEAILRLGVADPRSATLLVEKARRRGGHLGSEREEMALIGLLTIQILAHAFLEDFSTRARARRDQLRTVEAHVLVDRASNASSSASSASSAFATASSTPGPSQGHTT